MCLNAIRTWKFVNTVNKGLEFEQVVAFVRDYDFENEERLNAHYVAVTRAKEKMIIQLSIQIN